MDGKTVLITGGTKGIGAAVARRPASDGETVVINYNNDEVPANALVAEIEARGGRAIPLRADVSRVGEIRRLFEEAEAAVGRLDAVGANAATFVLKPLADLSEDEFDRMLSLNAKGTFFVLQEAVRRLPDGGRIIATSTGGTQMLFRGNAAYLGSKGAVEQFVRGLAQEVGERSITVNAVLPGFTDTGSLPDRDRAMAEGASPFGRIGQPADVGDVIAWLTGPDARWVADIGGFLCLGAGAQASLPAAVALRTSTDRGCDGHWRIVADRPDRAGESHAPGPVQTTSWSRTTRATACRSSA
jgi:3-oxoacyl-[acyl-carrier protein] reductase